MNSDSIQDSTRYIVKEEHYGNIMPGNRAETLRNVYLQSGAYIKGGIYSNELLITGTDIIIEEAVYCKNNIRFDFNFSKNKNDISFHSTVVCPGTILVPNNKSKIRFLSDIYSGKINLNNCIVYGNIYATSATLKNTIVLGGVYCKKDLKLKNTIVFTFRAGQCNLDNHVSILSPFGFAEKINIESTVNVLTFNNLFNDGGEIKHSGNIKLDETDIYEIELAKNEEVEDAQSKTVQVLSVAERLLNTSEIIENFKRNKDLIEFISLNSHLSEDDKEHFFANNKKDIEEQLWQIIEEKTDFGELVGYKSIHEMVMQYSKT